MASLTRTRNRLSTIRSTRAAGWLLLAALVCGTTAAQAQVWTNHGPSPNTRGQVENITDRPVTGSVNAVVAHPTNADVVYIGATNGGVWTTANAMATPPDWKRLTDDKQSLSIGALEMDPTDATHKTLVAGIGRFSSYFRDGGQRTGILRTTNGGGNWAALDGGGAIRGLNVSGVAPRGEVIVLSANTSDTPGKAGVWRSTNAGANWKHLSGAMGTGLPVGGSSTLAGNAKFPDRLFTNAGTNAATAGIYRSDDTGATWKKVSPMAMNNMIATAGNVKIAVGAGQNVYVAVVTGGALNGVFHSPNGGAVWNPMGVPTTSDGVGPHPGGQGGIHLSIAADTRNPDIVYVGGDRQDDPFPNVIGAKDYSGRLFRGDATQPAGKQWTHLTHKKTGVGGTASTSAPHADSRAMRMAANGVLIETDDGGVYKRTNPQDNTGDWFSMNGNLAVTEFHATAWDSNAKVVIGGTQDTGTPEQTKTNSPLWRSVATADGGCVAVDDQSAPNMSTRYSSNQFLSRFRRRVYNNLNALQSEVFPALTVLDGGPNLAPQFYTPIRLNTINRKRIIIGANNAVYESFDRADTVTALTPAVTVNGNGLNPIAYGGKGNEDMLYVGSNAQVFVRESLANPLAASATYSGGRVLGIALNPAKPTTAYVVSPDRVSRTIDAGGTWTDITGNLTAVGAARLRSIAYVSANATGAVVVGSDAGVFLAPGPAFNVWAKLGNGLANVPVFSLEYDHADVQLLAGTLGRGAWTISLTEMQGKPEPAEKLPIAAADAPVNAAPPPAKGPAAQPPKKDPLMTPFQLRPGLVVAADRRTIYAMTPGGIDAVDVSGKEVWRTDAAARPLGVVGDKLVGQVDPGKDRDLKVQSLDLKTGKPVGEQGKMAMPAGVRATVQATAQGAFTATTSTGPEADTTVVSWQFAERPRRGIPPGTEETLTPPGGGAAADVPLVPVKSGKLRMNLTTGAVGADDGLPVAMVVQNTAETVPVPQRLPNIAGRQLFSADRRHIMTSTQDDLNRWDSYKLTVHDLQGNKVGEFRSHVAAVPFFVADSLVIFETTPFRRRPAEGEKVKVDEDGLIDEPAKLRATDLKSGKEAWNKVVREAVYRGPLPP